MDLFALEITVFLMSRARRAAAQQFEVSHQYLGLLPYPNNDNWIILT